MSSVKSVGKTIGKLWTLFIMSITKRITNGIFLRYFLESSGTVHFPNCTVNYCSLQTKSPTDWKVVGVIWLFSEKFKLNKKIKLNITDRITDRFKLKIVVMIYELLIGLDKNNKRKTCYKKFLFKVFYLKLFLYSLSL